MQVSELIILYFFPCGVLSVLNSYYFSSRRRVEMIALSVVIRIVSVKLLRSSQYCLCR
jgi:hypothetical protein